MDEKSCFFDVEWFTGKMSFLVYLGWNNYIDFGRKQEITILVCAQSILNKNKIVKEMF